MRITNGGEKIFTVHGVHCIAPLAVDEGEGIWMEVKVSSIYQTASKEFVKDCLEAIDIDVDIQLPDNQDYIYTFTLTIKNVTIDIDFNYGDNEFTIACYGENLIVEL